MISWISKSFKIVKSNNGQGLEISGVPLLEILKKVKTPFYVYDWETIKSQFEDLIKNLSKNKMEFIKKQALD